MFKAYKYRLYPNNKQQILLNKHLGSVRFVYNWALEEKMKKYKLEEKNISGVDLKKQLVNLKNNEETKWLKEINSQSLQEAIVHLDKAFTRFFREKRGFPKFKRKHRKQSFSCPQNVKIDFNNLIVKLPKIGEIKTIFSRKFKGKVKTCTISKTSTNKYFISILVDTPEEFKVKVKIKKEKAIGIDLGIKDFLITSNGDKIDNPKYFRKNLYKLRKLQRKISKKKKGSNNRKKANFKVARMHEKIKNQRTDFLQKLSTKLIRENQTICLEDLNVSGMMKNHKLAKAIASASWSEFSRMLEYKAEWYGVNIFKINRFAPSSKMCNKCGWVNKELKLSDRQFKCAECGYEEDRDINAARNILDFGLHPKQICHEGVTNHYNIDKYSGQELPGEPVEMSR